MNLALLKKIGNMQKFFFVALLIILLSGNWVLACVCGDVPDVLSARDRATVVFSGEAVKTEYQKGAVYPDGKDAGEQLAVRFRVKQWWKGEPKQEILIFTEQFRASDNSITKSTCDFEYSIGKDYLVYAVEVEYAFKRKKLITTTCSRTAETDKAVEDLKKLGKGKKPKATRVNQ